MKIRKPFFIIFLLAIALFPSPALANGGSALLWTGIMQLFVGNAVIGYIEAGFLARFFQASRRKATLLLVVANYLSAWIAAILLVGRFSRIPTITIENIWSWLYLAIFLSFVLTLLIEYPFFWFLLRQQKNAVPKAIKATLIIHGLSYLGLFLWYAATSQTSLLTQLEVVPPEQLQPRQEYVLYFLNPEQQAIRSNLAGTQQQIIDRATLEALMPPSGRIYQPVPQLTQNTDWKYFTHFLAAGGISGRNSVTDERFQFSLETPFALWGINHAIHLEEDFLVFQLGSHQICILQPQRREIALIARGSMPIVVAPQAAIPVNGE